MSPTKTPVTCMSILDQDCDCLMEVKQFETSKVGVKGPVHFDVSTISLFFLTARKHFLISNP
uniref:Uncharacterized protein n=1 Tax=Rhizophora mucronata TaxID=61149 RepID=A0A2P2QM05_RHIMU